MSRDVPLPALPDAVADGVYQSGKYPLILDPTGTAYNFFKYRARCLSAMKMGDHEPESLRKGLTQCLHNGAWLVLDADVVDVNWEALITDKTCFPEEAFLGPTPLFNPDVYNLLVRDTDEFTAKVSYENLNIEQEGLQDRTKAFEPEKCVDVDKRFDPKDGFRLIVTTKKPDPPPYLAEKMDVINLQLGAGGGGGKGDDGVWAGGSAPIEERSAKQKKLDRDFVEACFEGQLEDIQKFLEEGADSNAVDGRKCTGLSEAACAGHMKVVEFLLNYNPPLGSDPVHQNQDGRTALHRAAFGGHKECVELLVA